MSKYCKAFISLSGLTGAAFGGGFTTKEFYNTNIKKKINNGGINNGEIIGEIAFGTFLIGTACFVGGVVGIVAGATLPISAPVILFEMLKDKNDHSKI